MTPQELAQSATTLSERARTLADDVHALALNSKLLAAQGEAGMHLDPAVLGLTVFVLACFIGYYVVWRVTPALHTPLMSVTNAISSIIAIGALVQVAPPINDSLERPAMWIIGLALASIALVAINMFGGFAVTQRMLQMFRK